MLFRSVAIDMPFVTAPAPFNGVEIAGWAIYDTTLEEAQTYPFAIRDWIWKQFGKKIRYKENSAPMSAKGFLRVRDQLLDITGKVADLAEALVKRESWDLFMVTFSAVHTGGHKLWDLSNVVGPISAAQKAEMLDALRQLYIACDRAIGRLLAAADKDARVITMAIHGMADNITRNEILPEMLRRVLADEYLERPSIRTAGWLPMLRTFLPANWRHAVKSRLPMRLQDKLTAFWRSGQGRWEAKRAFCLAADGQGMIRINLKGREAKGIVAPGPEFEALCDQIRDGLGSFVDADTGEPIIQNIARLETVLRKPGSLAPDCYPDLTIDWAPKPARLHRAVYSPKYGTIPWPVPGRNPEGRSGNHRMEGFLIAAGKDIKSGTIQGARMIDLAPTIFALLGQPVPEAMDGEPLDILR